LIIKPVTPNKSYTDTVSDFTRYVENNLSLLILEVLHHWSTSVSIGQDCTRLESSAVTFFINALDVCMVMVKTFRNGCPYLIVNWAVWRSKIQQTNVWLLSIQQSNSFTNAMCRGIVLLKRIYMSLIQWRLAKKWMN